MDAIAITGSRGLGGVSVPGYSDKTAFDTIGKALDIYNMADLGIGVLEIPVGALIGKVGNGRPFAIGTQSQPLPMPASGRLMLGVNDNALDDNSGSFTVVVAKQ